MSAAARTAIANAASTVPGIKVAPYFRQTTKAGDGMVRLDRMTRSANGFWFTNTWQVVVMLPAEIKAAEVFLESKIPALLLALEPAMRVTDVTPQQLALDTGLVPCVFIQGNREEE